MLEPYGDISEEYAFAAYDEQISCGVESGADLIFIQTFTDLAMAKIAATAARKHMLPMLCSFSFDQHGRTMMGNSVEQIIREMQPFSPDAIGLNCSLGPDAAVPVIREFARLTDLPLIFKPNAGKSTVEDGCDLHEYSAEVFADDCLPALEAGATYIGGCCGSNAHYIRHLRARLQELGYLE